MAVKRWMIGGGLVAVGIASAMLLARFIGQELKPDLIGDLVDEGQWCDIAILNTACTGIVIGPQVVLTAGHCVGASGRIAVDGTSGVCEEPSGSLNCPDGPDVAVCGMDRPITRNACSVRGQGGWARIGEPVVLLARGLRDSGVPFDNRLRRGGARVKSAPDERFGCMTVEGEVGACSGDSGGGAFLEPGRGRPALAGVISTAPCVLGREISLVDVTSPAILAFIQRWAGSDPERRICGMHPGVSGCRP